MAHKFVYNGNEIAEFINPDILILYFLNRYAIMIPQEMKNISYETFKVVFIFSLRARICDSSFRLLYFTLYNIL